MSGDTDQPGLLILASAGSGKTYRLTNRFIELLARGESPGAIVATTFTKAAAGEVLGRVFARLSDAASGGRELDQLRRDVDGGLTSSRCADLLASLVEHLGSVGVVTIDSLFMQMASASAFDLGLPPGWRVEEELADASRRSLAAEDALASFGAAESGAGRAAEIELLRDISRGEPGRSVHRELMRFVGAGYEALVTAGDDELLWSSPRPPSGVLDAESFAEELGRFELAPLPYTKGGTPNKRWAAGHEKVVGLLRRSAWAAACGETLTKAVRAGEPFSRAHAEPGYAELALPLFDHAVAAALIERTQRVRAVRDLLLRFASAYQGRKLADGALRFEDMPRLLLESGGPSAGEGLERLYYRLDARVRHLLLDEFQDTSVTQFRLLEPIVDELLAGDGSQVGRSVFCVGDAKQSLYAWRQAEPGLLASMADRWPAFQCESLAMSWRSSPPVLEAVNTVFSSVAENECCRGEPAAREWDEMFEPHDAARAQQPGRVRVIAAEYADGPDARRANVLGEVREIVADALDKRPAGTVGVLVRKNARVREVVEALRSTGLHAAERGGSPLARSPVCAALASLLWLIDHPGDTACAAHARLGPLADAAELPETGRIDRWASRRRRRIMREGVAGYVASLAARIAGSAEPAGAARLRQAVELAERVDKSGFGEARASTLSQLLRTYRSESADDGSVRVMTVHQSKGAEFDTVVLCDLESAPRTDPASFIVDRPGPLESPTAVTMRPPKELLGLQPELDALVERADQRSRLEQLCVLYVAMTRARRRLEIVLEQPPPKRSDRKLNRDADLLRETLVAPEQRGESGVLRELVQGSWWEDEADAPREHQIEDSPGAVAWQLMERPAPRARRAAVRSPSSIGAAQAGPSQGRDGADPDAAVRGEAVHAVFEGIGFLDDEVPPSREKIAERMRAHGLGLESAELWAETIASALQGESLCSVLSRGVIRGADRVELRREAPVFAELPESVARTLPGEASGPLVVSGRVDRLMIARDARGGATHAAVIDFKTSASVLSEDAMADRYGPQMDAYRHAVAGVLGVEAEQVSWWLVGLWPNGSTVFGGP
ncbi:MAG: UvrD-helicase domain-containing protein [Planctomycetota bacterium]